MNGATWYQFAIYLKGFASQGVISIGEKVTISYTYNAEQDTKNLRTLQGMAVRSGDIFQSCERCPLETFQKFVSYYGDFSYADDLVLAAFDQTTTNLDNANVDFQKVSTAGRAEAIQRLTVNLIVWMYVVGTMEYSVEACLKGDPADPGVSHWDSAVAYYVGLINDGDRMETNSTTTSLLYRVAEELCPEFGTCDNGGTAFVNRDIMKEFQLGQEKLEQGLCEEVKQIKQRIVSLMTVPIIQGTLFFTKTAQTNLQDERDQTAGYTFAAAILPLIFDCNKGDVGIIFEALRVPQTEAAATMDFYPLVKSFLEKQYECLEITCQDVGNLPGEEPCSVSNPPLIIDGNDNETETDGPIDGDSYGSGSSTFSTRDCILVCAAFFSFVPYPFFG